MIKYKNIIVYIAILILSFNQINAQAVGRQMEEVLLQFDAKKNIEYGKFGEDSVKLVLQIKNKNETFPSTYFIKAKILGDSSGFILTIPKDMKDTNAVWTFSEYIATANNDKTYIKAKEYATFAYSPFDYEFTTVPPQAEIYLVPLEDWEKIFNTEEIDFPFTNQDLPRILKYKILKITPCHYSLFEQPYIGVFVSGEKIKLEYIKPKRNTPKNNKAEINF